MRLKVLAVGAVGALVALAVLAFAPASGPGDGGHGGWGGMGGMGMMGGGGPGGWTNLPPELQSLRQVPPDQRFSHFQGGTMTFTTASGTQFTVNVTPGTVTSVTPNAITITPNGQTAAKSFGVTQNTAIKAQPKPGSFQAISTGDQVVVVTVGNSTDAAAIMKHPVPHVRASATAAPSPSATGTP